MIWSPWSALWPLRGLIRYVIRREVVYFVIALTSMAMYAMCGHHGRW